jgi:glycosyltransferase involved in cell wall biosynthesis
VRLAGQPALGMVCDDWMLYGPDVDAWTRRWRRLGRAAAGIGARATGVPAWLRLDRAAHWVFISDYTLNAARQSGLVLPGATVAHSGIDAEHLRAVPGRRPWGWRLLYCGRLDPRKGVTTAIEALPHLPPDASLTIKGDGEGGFEEQLHALADRLGVADRVDFRPSSIGDLAAVYAAADALVFPVRWREPWGLVPLEAMAAGTPVLASRAGGGVAEYLDDGRNCLQFDPGDVAGLVECVGRLAASVALRDGLREAGLATAARFTAAGFHDRFEHEMRVAVATHGGG